MQILNFPSRFLAFFPSQILIFPDFLPRNNGRLYTHGMADDQTYFERMDSPVEDNLQYAGH